MYIIGVSSKNYSCSFELPSETFSPPNETHMKRVIYREVIHVDGTDYTVGGLDYSTAVKEAIKEGVCANNKHDIIDWVLDDVMDSFREEILTKSLTKS